jgi:selenocysteine-specific elongation factor
MIIGTAGHIDHGKTTLVRALTGVDTDRLPEEKRRGITIELGFAPLVLGDVGTIGVVDVPGHEAFVRTMVAGATGIDIALVVVAADEGVMPQTREHLAVLALLHVPRAVVALTKCDLVDAEWLAMVTDDARAALAATPFADAEIVPVSATASVGLDALRAALAAAARDVPARPDAGPFRMPVDRAFSIRGIGTVVSGSVWSGVLARDASLRLLPSGRDVRVRGLHAFGQAVQEVRAGDRAAIALAGVELDEVGRGTVLVQGAAWQGSRVLRADVTLLADAPRPLGPRARVRLHLGTGDIAARVIAADGPVAPGASRSVRLVLQEPIAARAGDRFVLRAESPAATIGGGVVLDPQAPPRARPWPAESRSPSRALQLLLGEAGPAGLRIADLEVRLGLPAAQLAPLLGPASVWRVGDLLLDAGTRESLSAALLRLLDEFHARHPLAPGVAAGAARARLRAPEAVAAALFALLAAEGRIDGDHGMLRRAGFEPRLQGSDADLANRLIAALESAGREPPGLAELAARLQADAGRLGGVVHFLAREGRLVLVEPERCYLPHVVAGQLDALQRAMAPGSAYGAGDLKDALGVSRKFMIPFLEFCDGAGYTLRDAAGARRWNPARAGMVAS